MADESFQAVRGRGSGGGNRPSTQGQLRLSPGHGMNQGGQLRLSPGHGQGQRMGQGGQLRLSPGARGSEARGQQQQAGSPHHAGAGRGRGRGRASGGDGGPRGYSRSSSGDRGSGRGNRGSGQAGSRPWSAGQGSGGGGGGHGQNSSGGGSGRRYGGGGGGGYQSRGGTPSAPSWENEDLPQPSKQQATKDGKGEKHVDKPGKKCLQPEGAGGSSPGAGQSQAGPFRSSGSGEGAPSSYRGGGVHGAPSGGFSGSKPPRPRHGPPTWDKKPLSMCFPKDEKTIDKNFGSGWKDFPFERKEDVILQRYDGPDAKEYQKIISLSVNHFPFKKFRLPDRIYHYEVAIERVKRESTGGGGGGGEQNKPPAVPQPQLSSSKARGGAKGGGRDRGHGDDRASPPPGPRPFAGGAAAAWAPIGPRKLPKPLSQLVLTVLLDRLRTETKHFGIVSDLFNNVYSTKCLESLGVGLIHRVSMSDVDQTILQENDNGQVEVTLSPTNLEIDTREMQRQLESTGSWKGFYMDPAIKTSLEQVCNAIVKSMPTYRFLPLGRSNLARWPDGGGTQLGSNVVCWRGISANIAMGWQPYLCADLAHCAFLDDTKVMAALNERFRGAEDVTRWQPWQMDDAKSFLRNVKVKYTAKGITLAGSVTNVLRGSVSQETFELDQNGTKQMISVWEYFKMKCGTTLNKNGPCLELRKKNKVPAELCVIKKGQSFSRKLNDMQTRNMLTVAKKDPHVLLGEIYGEMEDLSSGAENSPRPTHHTGNRILQSFGIEVADEMLRMDNTRVLGAPQLRYGGGTKANAGKGDAIITPNQGQWDPWNADFKFLQSKTVSVWGIMTVGQDRYPLPDDDVFGFINRLKSNGARKGISLEGEPLWENMSHLDANYSNVDELINVFQALKKKKCELVVAIIPKKNSPLYSQVKQASELRVGILTQCVVAQNVSKGQEATVQNIILKLNSKLGGVNHAILPPPNAALLKQIDILKCPMLIIGADVTHPPPGSMKKIQKGNKIEEVHIPSFAAVTGSIDVTGMSFMMDIRAQRKADKGAAEVIQDLEEIISNMLLMFFKKTNETRPRKIIYFRDGVGEGQFPEVLHTEMLAMRRACSKFKDYDGGKYEPCITFITVQKRHKTRMFYHSEKGVANPPPGTVVDQEIVHQTETDFYLCSHAGMMGTSRPTRYHVLWDDSNFTADQIQTMTYYLCYMYIRCNKSVRIPAPTYYAHWAAARAKVLTEGLDEFFGDLGVLNMRMKREEAFMNEFPMHFV